MFERIVVAVDGSPRSEQTLAVAADLAGRYAATVTVVHVRESERYEATDVDMGPPVRAEDLVERALQHFRDAGVQAQGEIRRVGAGRTPEQIVDVASKTDADLIVMGTRGMTE